MINITIQRIYIFLTMKKIQKYYALPRIIQGEKYFRSHDKYKFEFKAMLYIKYNFSTHGIDKIHILSQNLFVFINKIFFIHG